MTKLPISVDLFRVDLFEPRDLGLWVGLNFGRQLDRVLLLDVHVTQLLFEEGRLHGVVAGVRAAAGEGGESVEDLTASQNFTG